MAEKRTINIDINNNADEAAKDFQDFAKATNVANDSVEGLNKTFEEVYGELQPLTTRMGEAEDRLYELALAGDTTSKEYNELLKSVGNYRKVQIQTDLAVDAAATTFSQKLGGALTGATSGFAAVQGVMGLVGSESEALEETLLKVQSALALQQGVQGVLEYSKSIGLAGKATKVFNLIVKANPLALLVTTIVAIIGYFAIFTDAIDVAIQGLKNLGDAIGLTNFAEQELEEKREERHKEEKQRQLDEIALLKQKQRIAEEDFQRNLAFQESLGKSTARLRKAKVLERIEDAKARAALLKGTVFEKEAQRTLIELRTELNNINKEIRAENKAASDERAAQDKKALDDAKKINDERKKQIDAEKAILQEGSEFLKNANFEEVDSTFNKYAAMGAMSMQFYKDEEDLRERNKKFAIDSAFQTLDLISNITELFGKKGEKQAKKAFKVQQAAQIATTLGTTYLSATQAYASQFLPLPDPSSPVRGGIAAGLAVAAGLANVAKIASQKFEGGGATGSTSVGGSVPEAPSAPQFNVVGDSGVNQLATLQQQPTMAYVVSGEVTTAQALDRNRVQNATL
jgi:hypothetical protein